MIRISRWSWLAVVGSALIGLASLAQAAAVGGSGGAAAAAAHGKAHGVPTNGSNGGDTLYALGVLLSHNLGAFDLSEQEFKQVVEGFSDGYHKRARVENIEAYIPQLKEMQLSRQKQIGARYAAKVAALPGARKTASGLVYVPSVRGGGASPSVADTVKVQYTGKLVDGTVFDSSYRRGTPVTFPLGGIIPCWKEALQLMKVGGKARVICPSDLAYGDRGAAGAIPPGATLDFQIELVDVTPAGSAGPPGAFAPPRPASPRPAAPGAVPR